MTVTHTDGFPVEPVDVDAVLIGMGRWRHDAAGDGVFPLVRLGRGRTPWPARCCPPGRARADAAFRPPGKTWGGSRRHLHRRTPGQLPYTSDLSMQARLTGSMMHYDWAINGRPYDQTVPLTIHEGQNATLTFANQTAMWHPMHLHEHTFQVIKAD